MTIEEALEHQLKSAAGLVALVQDRIYPGVAPQAVTIPYVTYQKTGDPRIHLMGADPDLSAPRFLVKSWGKTMGSAMAVAAQVRAAIQDSMTTWGGKDGVVVQRCFLEDQAKDFEPDTKSHCVLQEYTIWHEEQ